MTSSKKPRPVDSFQRSVAGIASAGSLFFAARRKQDDTEMSYRWEFPGGKVEETETDEEALEREFLEEFGARIQVVRYLGETMFAHRGRMRILAAWEIRMQPKDVAILNEHSEAAWLPFESITEMDLADSDRSLLPLVQAAFSALQKKM
jgi:8-oxo-dGTP diphosphatase